MSACQYQLSAKLSKKGDLKKVTGPRQVSLKSINLKATTCDNIAKSAKRKFVVIATETSTIDSPSKRPNSVSDNQTSPYNANDNNSDTSRDNTRQGGFHEKSTKSIAFIKCTAINFKMMSCCSHRYNC